MWEHKCQFVVLDIFQNFFSTLRCWVDVLMRFLTRDGRETGRTQRSQDEKRGSCLQGFKVLKYLWRHHQVISSVDGLRRLCYLSLDRGMLGTVRAVDSGSGVVIIWGMFRPFPCLTSWSTSSTFSVGASPKPWPRTRRQGQKHNCGIFVN